MLGAPPKKKPLPRQRFFYGPVGVGLDEAMWQSEAPLSLGKPRFHGACR